MLSESYLRLSLKLTKVFLLNIEMPGQLFTFQPSPLNAGGVGFYIKEDHLFTTRADLRLSTNDFEALWVEMQNGSQRSLICGVIYQRPHCNMQNFMDFLNPTIERIDKANKLCIILREFNLDLFETGFSLRYRRFYKYFRVLQLSTSYFITYSNY